MTTVFGAELRRVENREREGAELLVAIASRTYDTTIADLWSAITTPARIARWLTPVEGDLRLGGRFQLKGNAAGSITRCDPPEALDVTWEIMGGTSWVTVRLEPVGAGRTKFTLEHSALRSGIGEEHLAKFGPGAVGLGWELSLFGLAKHLADPAWAGDMSWFATDEAKALIRAGGAAWGEAHAAAGEDPAEARAKAERTIAAYGG